MAWSTWSPLHVHRLEEQVPGSDALWRSGRCPECCVKTSFIASSFSYNKVRVTCAGYLKWSQWKHSVWYRTGGNMSLKFVKAWRMYTPNWESSHSLRTQVVLGHGKFVSCKVVPLKWRVDFRSGCALLVGQSQFTYSLTPECHFHGLWVARTKHISKIRQIESLSQCKKQKRICNHG